MSKTEIYTYRNPPPGPGIDCPPETLTQQHFQQECDINSILARHGVLEQLPGAFYCSFDTSRDLRESLELLREAEESFLSLPSAVRDKFANDPARLLDFVNDPNNHSRFAEFGLAEVSLGGRNSTSLDVTVPTDTSTLRQEQQQ